MKDNLYLVLYNEISSPGTPYEVIKDKFAIITANSREDAISRLDVVLYNKDDTPLGMTVNYYNYRVFPIDPSEIVLGDKKTMQLFTNKGEELNVYHD